MRGAHFFAFPTGAALGQCSHCEICGLLDTDADTVTLSDLEFDDATVPRRIAWRATNEKGIFHDLDGSLTGKGSDSWATSYWKHNEWADSTACEYIPDMYDGFVCDNTVTVRKILFHDPSGSITGKTLNLWQWDTNVAGMTVDEKWNFQSADENAAKIIFEPGANPTKHWTVPYVIPKNGKRTFYGRWGAGGYDFASLTLERTKALWTAEDGEIEFIMSFYAIREAIYFDDSTGARHDNETFSDASHAMCDNVVYNRTFNETQPKNFTVRVSHADPAIGQCRMTGVQCLNNCWDQIGDVTDDGTFDEDVVALWSDPASWPQLPNRIPTDGDDIEIGTSQNIVMDVYETPVLGSLEINGKLSCQSGQPCVIHAYSLWVRQGILEIGTADVPFDDIAIITLHGNNTEEYWAFTPQIDSGNKNLVVTGTANFYG